MNRNTWKAGERRVAKFFGASGRTPLSGGNSGHTRSDTLHPTLFIEVKHRKNDAARNLHDSTKELAKKEGKVPVLALLRKGSPGFLICIHSDDFENVIKEYHKREDSE